MYSSSIEEYRDKMLDWGLSLSQYLPQCQATSPRGSGFDNVVNTAQAR